MRVAERSSGTAVGRAAATAGGRTAGRDEERAGETEAERVVLARAPRSRLGPYNYYSKYKSKYFRFESKPKYVKIL